MALAPLRHARTSSVALGLLALAVITAPLARGGVDLPVEVGLLVLCAGAAGVAVTTRPNVTGHVVALAAVLAWMTIQLLPIPIPLHSLSPATTSMFRLTLADIGRYPSARPFSLDLANGHREVAKATTCLLAAIAAASFANTRRRKMFLLRMLGLSGVAVAGAVLACALLGLTSPIVPALPFVNPNHLAGFLNLTGFLALGQSLRASGRARAVWAVCFAAVAAVVFASLSRAGIIAFSLGIGVFTLWIWRRRLVPDRSRAVLLFLVVGGAIATAALLALHPVIQELRSIQPTETSFKVNLWPMGVRVIRDFPLTGVGRGAFATVFQAYRHDFDLVTFTHLENEWLQPLIDLGIPVGLLLLGTLMWAWFTAARRTTSVTEVSLLVGMLALAVQLGFDFSVEILGVGVPLSVSLGLLLSHRARLALPITARLGFVLVVFAAALLHVQAFREAERRLRDLGSAPIDLIADRGSDVVADRPADYLPHLVAGARLAEAGRCKEALPWLRRTELIAPGVPEAHAYAGRCMAREPSSEGAVQEYALAFALGQRAVLSDAVSRWSSLRVLTRIGGSTPDGLLALGEALSADRPSDAKEVLEKLTLDFRDERAWLPLARVALKVGDLDLALRAAREQERAAPLDPEGYVAAANALAAGDDAAGARAEVERGLEAIPGATPLIGVLVAWDIKDGRFAEARRRAFDIAPRTPFDLASRHVLLAKVLAAQQRIPEAVAELEAAVDAQADDPRLLIFLADLRARLGLTDEAVAALERAAALPGGPTREIMDRLESLRQAQQPRHTVSPTPSADESP
jgi:tetratricopeptide (TPR) repeat protein